MTASPRQPGKGRRTLIIGSGLMGRHHARAARRAGSDVVGIVDLDLAAAQRLAARHPGAAAARDVGEAVATLAVDAAHVCTPLDTHAPIAALLAGGGIHALVEKPLAATEPDTRAMVEAFARARRRLCPVHQYAFQRSMRHARGVLPQLGDLRRIAFEIASAGGNGRDAGALDLVAAEIVPHPLAMLQRLTDADLAAVRWTMDRPAPGEWLATASLGGTIVSIAISLGARPTAFRTALLGSRGSIHFDNFHDFALQMGGRTSRAAKIAQPLVYGTKLALGAGLNLAARAARGEGAYPGLRTLVHRFYASAFCGAEPPISDAQTIAVAAARDRLIGLARATAHG